MGTVRRHNTKEYLVVETIVKEVVSQVTTMAVNDKEAVVSPAASFLLCIAIEYLL
jgi:hypothetical protein